MNAFLSKRWMVILLLTGCLIAVPACVFSQGNTQPVGVQAATAAASASTAVATSEVPEAATNSPTSSPTPEPTAEAPVEMFTANVDFGPGSFNLEDPTVGLSDLSSYKATLKLSFDGTDGGQPNQWSRTYVMLSSQEPAAHQITIETTGGTLAPVFMAEVNGVTYERKGENPCTAATTEEGNSLSARWEPAGFLSGIIGADTAGAETINGVAANHYTFDERALGQAGLSQSTGQMWVASDKGFLVRYLLTTKSDAAYFGDGIEGTLTWEYNLTDLNQPVLVKLPAGCPGGLVDAPMLPDAQNVRRLLGVTIYSTAGSIKDSLAFYQEKLPALGWKISGTPGVSDAIGLATFVKGDQQLSVIVTPADNMVEVRLVIGAPSKPMAIPGLP